MGKECASNRNHDATCEPKVVHENKTIKLSSKASDLKLLPVTEASQKLCKSTCM